jgi:phosphoserine phosphatase
MRNRNNMKNNRTKTRAFVFDFDDTLAHTSAVEREGTDDRFAEFNDPSTILNGTPLELMTLAKEVYDEGHPVFILTARNKRIAHAIAEFLSGFDIEATEIHCIGEDSPEQGNVGQNVAKAKRTVLLSIIENHDVIYFFDDDEKNIELASELDCRARKV